MQISETRIKLVNRRKDRLKAFCSVTFDNEFVVRDLKVIEGPNGFFVAMPSRKLTDHCPSCGNKNYVRSRYCSQCGMQLDENRHNRRRSPGKAKLHADIAHPINAKCRELIQNKVLEAYHREQERSRQPGYKPPVMDFDDYDNDYHNNFGKPHGNTPGVSDMPASENTETTPHEENKENTDTSQ